MAAARISIRELSRGEIEFIYKQYMRTDFPPGELKPLHMILAEFDASRCLCFGAFEEKEVLSAYGFFRLKENVALCDYFAVIADRRNQGIGKAFLREMLSSARLPDMLLVEVESPQYASADFERSLRERRIRFYRAAGLKEGAIGFRTFGVEYELMYFDRNGADISSDALASAYRLFYPKYRSLGRVVRLW